MKLYILAFFPLMTCITSPEPSSLETKENAPSFPIHSAVKRSSRSSRTKTQDHSNAFDWLYELFPENQNYVINHSGPNITNCVWSVHENTSFVMLECRGVVIENTANQIPKNMTILSFYNCPGSSNLSNPVLSHLNELHRLVIRMSAVKYIGANFLSGLVNLRELDLIDNLIATLDPDLMKNVPNVLYLDLRGNVLTEMRNVAKAVSVLRNLTTLVLDNNPGIKRILVESLQPLQDTSLEALSLSNCGIFKFEMEALRPLPSLKKLILGDNVFNGDVLLNITRGLEWTKIEHLQLRNLTSVFTGVKYITKELRPLNNTQISFLDLDYNRIHELRRFSFPKLTYLRKLRLCNCELEYISVKAFHDLINLRELYLMHNKLGSVHFEIPSLNYLDISYGSVGKTALKLEDHGLESFGNMHRFVLRKSRYKGPITRYTFSGLTNLDSLEVTHTYLSDIHPSAFADLGNLKTLTLSYNHLTEIRRKMFDGLKNVTHLYLARNMIDTIADSDVFEPLESLEHLSLHDNFIKTLPEHLFFLNHKLTYVTLHNNRIQAWFHEVFSSNSVLEIQLENNEIEVVSSAMLSAFKTLRSVDLSGNPFKCNTCEMKYFQIWLRNDIQSVRNLDETLCADSPFGNTTVLDFVITEEACIVQASQDGMVLTLFLTIACVVFLGCLLSMYKLRWKCRPELLHSMRPRLHQYREIGFSRDDRVRLNVNN